MHWLKDSVTSKGHIRSFLRISAVILAVKSLILCLIKYQQGQIGNLWDSAPKSMETHNSAVILILPAKQYVKSGVSSPCSTSQLFPLTFSLMPVAGKSSK